MRCIWEQSLRGSDAGGCRSDPLRHSVTEVSYILCTKRVSWPPASTFGTNWTNTCVGQQCNLHTTRKYNHDAANTCNIVFRGRTEGSSRGAEGILAPGQVAVNLRSYQLDSTFATVRQVWNRCMWNGSSHFGFSFVLSNNNHCSCNFEQNTVHKPFGCAPKMHLHFLIWYPTVNAKLQCDLAPEWSCFRLQVARKPAAAAEQRERHYWLVSDVTVKFTAVSSLWMCGVWVYLTTEHSLSSEQ